MPLPLTAVDVVVVGSGITGAATAAAVAARGASVLVVDKEAGPAQEASGRAQGSLRVQGRHPSELVLAVEAIDGWRRAMADDPTHDIEWTDSGNLYVQTRPSEGALLAGLVGQAHAAGLTGVRLLDADELHRVVPAMTGPVLGGMWSPFDAQCEPGKATALFVRRARRSGAEFAYGVKVTGVASRGDRVVGIDTVDGPVRAGAVVVAAGVWTAYLTSTVGVKVPIMPVCLSEMETAPLPPLFTPSLRAFGFGARQRPDGRIIVSGGLGATVTRHVSFYDMHGLRFWLPRAAAFRRTLRLRVAGRRVVAELCAGSALAPALIPSTSPEPRPLRRELDGALARLGVAVPGAADASVQRYWGGLVDMTPDGLPIVDRPGPAGLTVIAGLSGHGLALGPVLGEIGADLALDGRSRRPIGEFALARFAGSVAHPEIMI